MTEQEGPRSARGEIWGIVILVLAFGCCAQLLAQDQDPVMIEEIRLQGLDRLGTAEVLARMKIRAGDPWNPEELDAEYRRLWSSGDFISIDSPVIDQTPGGVIITIRMLERKPVHKVVFEGADNLSEKAAQKAIRTEKDELYDPLLVRGIIAASQCRTLHINMCSRREAVRTYL
jgi:outer membrane protein assembly factor BamA